MAAMERLHTAYAARHTLPEDSAACVGCITQAVPIELIFAAGLRPVRLFGDPSRSPTLGDRYMEEEIDGEVRSLFDRLLSGAASALPLILLPRVSEQHLQLHYYVAAVRAWEPDAEIPPVEIVDIMQTSYWSTGRYVRARLVELADRLGQMGEPVTTDRLADAISLVNRMRKALQALNALRRDGHVKGSDMFRLTAMFGALPPDEFLALADDMLPDSGPRASGPKVMLSGVQQDDPMLYELIEAAGAHVAADDHVSGERVFAHLVDETADPFDALAEHYQLHAPGLRQYPQGRQDDRFIATCKAARIDADLCVLEDGDDTLGWDWPRRRDRLKTFHIRSHLLPGQRYFHPDRAARAKAIDALLAECARKTA